MAIIALSVANRKSSKSGKYGLDVIKVSDYIEGYRDSVSASHNGKFVERKVINGHVS